MNLRAHLIGAVAALLACAAIGAQADAAVVGGPRFPLPSHRVLNPQAHQHAFTAKTWFAPGMREAIRTGAKKVLYVNDASGSGTVLILALKKNGLPGGIAGAIATGFYNIGGIAVDNSRNVYVGGYVCCNPESQEILEFPPGSSTPSNTMNYTVDGESTCCYGELAIAVDGSNPANVYSNAEAYNPNFGFEWGTLEWTGGSQSPTNFIYNSNNPYYEMYGLAVDGSDNVLATQSYCCDSSGYEATQLETAANGVSVFNPPLTLSANTYPVWLAVTPLGDLQAGDDWQYFGCPSNCTDVVATYSPGSTTATSSYTADFPELSATIGPKDLSVDMDDSNNCDWIQSYSKAGKLLQMENTPVCGLYMAVSPTLKKGTWGT